ncbi:Tunicamycin resistance protein [Frankia canadensis]|uniref:Tunicamycin resistance protein n=1 Tax=Frankia canadensis TaxID=1836972 RepID=A0A2I2L1H7_9ACTN|nr:ATP-binding protein [Frankia canadensis]SNQ51759.1 Tunicamycin resistance protein [Frankia canadensis]SOU59049.1 Tunicamycin resistance protein [Frankia canadensis]
MPTLIWINGPNAVGKTQAAHNLHRRLPGSFVSDPEHLGFAMRRMLPKARRTDFREIPQWRCAVGEMLLRALRGPENPVITPMTILDPDLLTDLTAQVRAAGHQVDHVTLLADRATMTRRIHLRAENSRSYSARNLDRALEVLSAPAFARHLHTDTLSISAVADDIAHHAGFTPTPDTSWRLARHGRQLAVQLRHIRLNA